MQLFIYYYLLQVDFFKKIVVNFKFLELSDGTENLNNKNGFCSTQSTFPTQNSLFLFLLQDSFLQGLDFLLLFLLFYFYIFQIAIT